MSAFDPKRTLADRNCAAIRSGNELRTTRFCFSAFLMGRLIYPSVHAPIHFEESFVNRRAISQFTRSPRKKRSGNLFGRNLMAFIPKGTCRDFVTGDDFRNLNRDGDWLRTRPNLANPV
jgi:hypothetical protein